VGWGVMPGTYTRLRNRPFGVMRSVAPRAPADVRKTTESAVPP
jgi:hypothetical protein